MRWRASQKYGISGKANVELLQSAVSSASAPEQQQLLEAWRWLARAEADLNRGTSLKMLEASLEGACTSLSQVITTAIPTAIPPRSHRDPTATPQS